MSSFLTPCFEFNIATARAHQSQHDCEKERTQEKRERGRAGAVRASTNKVTDLNSQSNNNFASSFPCIGIPNRIG